MSKSVTSMLAIFVRSCMDFDLSKHVIDSVKEVQAKFFCLRSEKFSVFFFRINFNQS